MSIKLPKPIIFLMAFIVGLALFWPAMNGTPIWDDYSFWFHDPVMSSGMAYSTIWAKFAWPLSVSLQKLTMSMWSKNYFNYHLLNFCLHFANSLLVYQLARLVRTKYPVILFFLFLLHPVSVISTAWMIQIKTLLCFFFGLSAILTFVKGNRDFKWMIFSWILFACSITSKSASLTLPLILLIVSIRLYRFKKLPLLIPFFLLSGWGTYRVLTSPITFEGSQKAAKITKIKVDPIVKETPPAPAAPIAKVKKNPKVVKPVPKVETRKQPAPTDVIVELPKKEVVTDNTPTAKENASSLKFINLNFTIIAQTLNYYFWQTVMPLDNEPVKGLNYKNLEFTEIIHLFLLGCLTFIFLKDVGFIYLGAAHFLLLPFLGIIPAPFMNVTWVSDQHLYLALPAFLLFWMRVVEKVKWKHAYVLLIAIIFFFSFKTYKASSFYENQIVFYEKCIKYNPFNLPIAYNLAFAYVLNNELEKASNLLDQTIRLTEDYPILKKSIFFPHVLHLSLKFKTAQEVP
jgi:hypothetical protein